RSRRLDGGAGGEDAEGVAGRGRRTSPHTSPKRQRGGRRVPSLALRACVRPRTSPKRQRGDDTSSKRQRGDTSPKRQRGDSAGQRRHMALSARLEGDAACLGRAARRCNADAGGAGETRPAATLQSRAILDEITNS